MKLTTTTQCSWTFRVSWRAYGEPHVSTINLAVLPAATRPQRHHRSRFRTVRPTRCETS
jgi:hypothetical protein